MLHPMLVHHHLLAERCVSFVFGYMMSDRVMRGVRLDRGEVTGRMCQVMMTDGAVFGRDMVAADNRHLVRMVTPVMRSVMRGRRARGRFVLGGQIPADRRRA